MQSSIHKVLLVRSFFTVCVCERVLPVELDKHQVPDLQHIGIIHVHQVRGVSPSNAVVVDLTARATGAGISHLPEVILHTARQDASLIHAKPNKETERGRS